MTIEVDSAGSGVAATAIVVIGAVAVVGNDVGNADGAGSGVARSTPKWMTTAEIEIKSAGNVNQQQQRESIKDIRVSAAVVVFSISS
jgi:hypothetical protein